MAIVVGCQAPAEPKVVEESRVCTYADREVSACTALATGMLFDEDGDRIRSKMMGCERRPGPSALVRWRVFAQEVIGFHANVLFAPVEPGQALTPIGVEPIPLEWPCGSRCLDAAPRTLWTMNPASCPDNGKQEGIAVTIPDSEATACRNTRLVTGMDTAWCDEPLQVNELYLLREKRLSVVQNAEVKLTSFGATVVLDGKTKELVDGWSVHELMSRLWKEPPDLEQSCDDVIESVVVGRNARGWRVALRSCLPVVSIGLLQSVLDKSH